MATNSSIRIGIVLPILALSFGANERTWDDWE